MNEEKRKPGRPFKDDGYVKKMSEVRVTSDQKEVYEIAALKAGSGYSTWVRASLDAASTFTPRQIKRYKKAADNAGLSCIKWVRRVLDDNS